MPTLLPLGRGHLVHRAAVVADPGRGQVHEPADRAGRPGEAEFPVPGPGAGRGGRAVRPGPSRWLPLQPAPPGQIRRVANVLPALSCASTATRWRRVAKLAGGAQDQPVAAVGRAEDQDRLPRLSVVQHGRQRHPGVGHARVPHRREGGGHGPGDQRFSPSRHGAVGGDQDHVIGLFQLGAGQGRGRGLTDQRRVLLVAEAFLPDVGRGPRGQPPPVQDLGRPRRLADDVGIPPSPSSPYPNTNAAAASPPPRSSADPGCPVRTSASTAIPPSAAALRSAATPDRADPARSPRTPANRNPGPREWRRRWSCPDRRVRWWRSTDRPGPPPPRWAARTARPGPPPPPSWCCPRRTRPPPADPGRRRSPA